MRASVQIAAIILALGIAGCAERVHGPGKPTGHTIVIVSPTTVPDTTVAGQPPSPGLPVDTGGVVIIVKP